MICVLLSFFGPSIPPGLMWQNLTVIVVCLFCAYSDWSFNKVFNRYSYGGVLAGLTLNLILGPSYFLASLIGVFGSFCLLFVFFQLKAFAAGDIKLMVAIAACKGFLFTAYTGFYSLCFACLYCLCWLAWKRQLLQTLKEVGLRLMSLFAPAVRFAASTGQKTPLCFAPSVLVGTVIAICVDIVDGVVK